MVREVSEVIAATLGVGVTGPLLESCSMHQVIDMTRVR